MSLPEPTHALFVGGLLVVLFLSFVREWVKPDVAVLGSMAALPITLLGSGFMLLFWPFQPV